MLAESDDKKAGGDMENEAAEISNFMKKEGAGTMHFKAPRQPGGYRLFAMVYYQNKVAYNNIPFKVVAASSDENKRAVKFKKFNMESFSEQ
jgi:hypothetical protein